MVGGCLGLVRDRLLYITHMSRQAFVSQLLVIVSQVSVSLTSQPGLSCAPAKRFLSSAHK
jgi:hypothetical protein